VVTPSISPANMCGPYLPHLPPSSLYIKGREGSMCLSCVLTSSHLIYTFLTLSPNTNVACPWRHHLLEERRKEGRKKEDRGRPLIACHQPNKQQQTASQFKGGRWRKEGDNLGGMGSIRNNIWVEGKEVPEPKFTPQSHGEVGRRGCCSSLAVSSHM